MGLSNPAVGRLSLTWEVRPGAAAAAIVLRPRCNLRFLCPQKLPSKFRKFYREFENLMVSRSSGLRPLGKLLSGCLGWNCVSSGPVQEPPRLPADRGQAGSSHHSFHASAN